MYRANRRPAGPDKIDLRLHRSTADGATTDAAAEVAWLARVAKAPLAVESGRPSTADEPDVFPNPEESKA
jgi:hypothetical protein